MRTTSQADLAVRLRLVIARTARRLRQEAGEELSPSQAAALATIDHHGPLTPSELAVRERIRRPTATRVIARLEEAGLVDRTRDPDDRRSCVVGLTPGGRELVARVRTRKDAYLSRRLRDLDADERETLDRAAAILERVLEGGRCLTAALRRAGTSLAVPNYRRYFAGQIVSVSGNWMQTVAEMWLIVQLTGSGAAVGITAGLQFVPILLFGAWGGLIADRLPKRRVLMVTQALMALPALTLFALTIAGSVTPLVVWALVLLRGAVNAVDNPTRQSFVVELVGAERVVNAVSLNSVIVQSARIVGPASAGAVIAFAGVSACFALNALSFVAMLVALAGMDPAALRAAAPVQRARGELRAALRHVRANAGLWIPLAMMALVGTLSFNFQVLMPLLASQTWHGTAATYALLTAAMAVGSVAGALAAGARGRVSPRILVVAATGFGALELLAAVAPSLPLQVLALIPLGAMTVTFSAGVNSSIQLAVAPAMRGRVMALYSVVFLGSTPIGAPLVGWLAELAGPRVGMALGACAALAAAALASAAYARSGERQVATAAVAA